ncbi:hypothetical protein JOD20_002619 [Herpetosiphon giganteus]|nr:hypothetical protein [Herpetosiphon giganteus]
MNAKAKSLYVLIHWIGNHVPSPSSPSPTKTRARGSTRFHRAVQQNHRIKAPRPPRGRGVGVRGSGGG